MNILISIVIVALIAVILLQRSSFERMRQSARFMSYYAKLNENAKQHAEFKADTAETLLKMYGYDVDRIASGDSGQRFVSEADKQALLKAHYANQYQLDEADKVFEQAKEKYESETVA
ncbi:hypothetical protein [Leuconostoc inhae]|uniref:hypothetical protein n=1 Tax=Leuconostoc inhae TaxID=178001 RepID=UPI001C7CD437|nr:hypothetical protein [Leuconostoc inhae]